MIMSLISSIVCHKALSAAIIAGAWFLIRFIRRSRSPTIESKLACPCGKIEGKIRAKKEDSLRIYCFCTDCRAYSCKVAQVGKTKPVIHSSGEAHLLQVCKDSIIIEKGQENLKLARKGPNQGMFRYYSGCCHVPIMNTVDFLGFAGVYEDNLDQNVDKFVGPYGFMVHEASKQVVDHSLPTNLVPIFLGNLIKYIPWRSSGPFDYSLQPIFWGNECKKCS